MVISYTEFIWLWSEYLKLRKCDQYTKALENWVWSDLYLIHNHRYALAGLSILIFSELASSTPLTVFIWQFKFQQSAEEYRKNMFVALSADEMTPSKLSEVVTTSCWTNFLTRWQKYNLSQLIDNSKDRNSRLQTWAATLLIFVTSIPLLGWGKASPPVLWDNNAIKITTQNSSFHRCE